MRFISILIIGILSISILILGAIEHYYILPQISLPKSAQHNTIGELPIVEMADDGVFAEVDGAEVIYQTQRKNSCQGALESHCDWIYEKYPGKRERKKKRKEYDEMAYDGCINCFGTIPTFKTKELCYEKAEELCRTGTPTCGDLNTWGLGIYTCWGTFE